MWILTTIGFFSVVQKPSDKEADTLTVRARVEDDLVALKERYLPELSEIQSSVRTDYKFRATAPRAAVSRALSDLVMSINYDNFKDEVTEVQGYKRARTYEDVWASLYRLQH